MSDIAIRYASHTDVKSKHFGFDSMFPRQNIDEQFKEYFSKGSSGDGFVDLHGELQRLDLRG